MHTPNDTIATLNTILKHELAAINQYFLHARMLKHQEHMELADAEYKQSIDEMKHADQLVERVLALGGKPNLQELGVLNIGDNVAHILNCDLALLEQAHIALSQAMQAMRKAGDQDSSALLSNIIASKQAHAEFIQTQLGAIDKQDESSYMQAPA